MRLYIVVEGQTEEEFVKHVLRPQLERYGVRAEVIVVTTRRDRRTGKKLDQGGGHWKHWCRDIRRLVGEHPGHGVRFTTLFDLYGLPDDFPRRSEYEAVADTNQRVSLLEQAMQEEVGDWRLIPYLQRHEFEALVLAGLDALTDLLDTREELAGLEHLRASIAGCPPEDINDGIETAPSKRLATSIPGYDKALHGPLAAESVGLPVLRQACPRFDAWVTRLEQLAGNSEP